MDLKDVEKIGKEENIKELREAFMQEKDEVIRIAIVKTLGKIGSEETIGPLFRALKDEKSIVRIAAAEILTGSTKIKQNMLKYFLAGML